MTYVRIMMMVGVSGAAILVPDERGISGSPGPQVRGGPASRRAEPAEPVVSGGALRRPGPFDHLRRLAGDR